jgi:hypothetical protein
VVNFLEKYPELTKNIVHIISVGLGYSVYNDDINCEMKYIKEKKSLYII